MEGRKKLGCAPSSLIIAKLFRAPYGGVSCIMINPNWLPSPEFVAFIGASIMFVLFPAVVAYATWNTLRHALKTRVISIRRIVFELDYEPAMFGLVFILHIVGLLGYIWICIYATLELIGRLV